MDADELKIMEERAGKFKLDKTKGFCRFQGEIYGCYKIASMKNVKVVKSVFCMKCGKKIPDYARFCPQCGEKVIGNEARTNK